MSETDAGPVALAPFHSACTRLYRVMPPTSSNVSAPKGSRGQQWARSTHALKQQRRAVPRPPPKKMSNEEIDVLRGFMKEQLGGKLPREFQVEVAVAQEERKDFVGQIPTGQGKSYAAAAPYAFEKNCTDKRVTLMVSPLIGLQDEMVGSLSQNYCSWTYHSKMSISTRLRRSELSSTCLQLQ